MSRLGQKPLGSHDVAGCVLVAPVRHSKSFSDSISPPLNTRHWVDEVDEDAWQQQALRLGEQDAEQATATQDVAGTDYDPRGGLDPSNSDEEKVDNSPGASNALDSDSSNSSSSTCSSSSSSSSST